MNDARCGVSRKTSFQRAGRGVVQREEWGKMMKKKEKEGKREEQPASWWKNNVAIFPYRKSSWSGRARVGILSEPRPNQRKKGVNNVKTAGLPAFVVNSTWNLRVDALYVSIIRLGKHCNAPVAFCNRAPSSISIIWPIIAIINLFSLFFFIYRFLLTPLQIVFTLILLEDQDSHFCKSSFPTDSSRFNKDQIPGRFIISK